MPEKIAKLETDFKSRTGVHFRGESRKLYSCDSLEKSCIVLESLPPKYEDNKPFKESETLYPRFKPPSQDAKQIVIDYGRGLTGHRNVVQFALLKNGEVWHWSYSGNDMGNSFPFWHLNNWIILTIGTVIGFVFGLILSIIIWFLKYPRS